MSDWETNAQRVGAAQQLWVTRLYYCARHDVVFLEGDTRTVTPEALLTLLCEGAPMQVAPRPQLPLTIEQQQRQPTPLDAAQSLYDQERLEEARVELERLTQESPISFMAWALLSRTLGDLWRREKALQAAETAVRLNARNPMALAAYAAALNGDDRYSEGLIAAEQALAINSQYLPALRAKAVALALGKRTEAALVVLESALRYNPTNFELLLTTASLLGDAERPGEAIAVCQNALRVRPESVAAHLLLALASGLAAALGLAGDAQASQRLVSQMMALHPQDFRVYVAQGAYYLAIGQPWQAVSAYNRALAMNRESEPLRRQRNTALAIALQPRKRTG